MVGGGIFAVLGLAVALAGGGTPLAFVLGGLIALVTTYSYARLSVTFPSQGGTVKFIDQAFGGNFFTGSLNTLLWLSYVVMLALYAFAFGGYGATFLPDGWQGWGKPAVIALAILLPAALNLLSADIVGKAETYVVITKVALLTLFVGIGSIGIDTRRLAPDTWASPVQLLAGGMIIFVAYEGFELIANTAQDVRDYKRVLPRAYFAAVGFVIVLYFLVSLVTVGNLSLDQIAKAKDYALAAAARPFLGDFGFRLIAVTALLSTFSAINATLYGSARLSFTIAKEGELPAFPGEEGVEPAHRRADHHDHPGSSAGRTRRPFLNLNSREHRVSYCFCRGQRGQLGAGGEDLESSLDFRFRGGGLSDGGRSAGRPRSQPES